MVAVKALLLLAVVVASSPARGRPELLLLTAGASPTELEQDLLRQLDLRLPEHSVSARPAPAEFLDQSLEERSAGLGSALGAHSASLAVWLDPGSPRVRLLVAASSGSELKVITGEGLATAAAELALLAEEIQRRHELADASARPRPADEPASLQTSSPEARARAGSVGVEAELGAAAPAVGTKAVGLVMVRGLAAVRSGPWRAGAGLEAWPLTWDDGGGWGVGPYLRGGYALFRALEVGASAALVGHQLSVPERLQSAEAQWALRTAARLRLVHAVGAWRLGAALELGLWPVRTELREGDAVVTSLPVVDGSLALSVAWGL